MNTLNITETDKERIQNIFIESEKPFSDLMTDYKREKALENSKCYIKPTFYFTGNTVERKFVNQVYTIIPGWL